jgi:hypothetical protein
MSLRHVVSSLIGKTACGRFSDIGFVAAGKKRGFCRLRKAGQRKFDRLPVPV